MRDGDTPGVTLISSAVDLITERVIGMPTDDPLLFPPRHRHPLSLTSLILPIDSHPLQPKLLHIYRWWIIICLRVKNSQPRNTIGLRQYLFDISYKNLRDQYDNLVNVRFVLNEVDHKSPRKIADARARFFFTSRFPNIVNWSVRLVYRACFVENMRKWNKKKTVRKTNNDRAVRCQFPRVRDTS